MCSFRHVCCFVPVLALRSDKVHHVDRRVSLQKVVKLITVICRSICRQRRTLLAFFLNNRRSIRTQLVNSLLLLLWRFEYQLIDFRWLYVVNHSV